MNNRTLTSLRKPLIGLLGLAAVAALGLGTAFAESPPAPPARFVGTVTVNGAPAAAGTTIEAHIGSTTCGVTTAFTSGATTRYTLDSPALDPGANPNCGTDGATVTFFVGGQQANPTGAWHSYQLNSVDLTVTTATATPSTSPSGGATATITPGAPVAGSGVAASSSSTGEWFALAAAALCVVGVGGTTLALARKHNR